MVKHYILALSLICATITLVFLPDAFYGSLAWGAEIHQQATKKHRVETKPKNHVERLYASKKSLAQGKVIPMKVTAYCMPGTKTNARHKTPDINGPDGTASGVPLKVGVAAVHPRMLHILPFGTQLHVKGFGMVTVLDTIGTGSADLDIFAGRGDVGRKNAKHWGSRHVDVEIMKVPENGSFRAKDYELAQE